MAGQLGHYSGQELDWTIEALGGTPLAEIQSVDYSFDVSIEPGGAGLGQLKNTYWKTVAPPKGSGKISRNQLQRADTGQLFLDIAAGSKFLQQEKIASGATTYTLGLTASLVGIVAIKLNTSGDLLKEGVDFFINYVTGIITIPIALPEDATVFYVTTQKRGQQYLFNIGFEDVLTNVWIPFATATLARNSTAANVLSGTQALAVTPAAQNDGVQFNVSMMLQPGRVYRLRYWAKAAAAEVMSPFFNDGSGDVAMSPATQTLTTTYAAYEHTFTATKSTIPNLKIKDTKVGPALFYLDQVALIDDTASEAQSPMNAGLASPFPFNLVARRKSDSVVVAKLMNCAIDKVDFKGGMAKYTEDVSFGFLDSLGE